MKLAALARHALDADRRPSPRPAGARWQAQPGAAVAAGGGAVGLHEVVEEVFDLVGPQADAGVFDAEADPLPPVGRRLALDAQRETWPAGVN